MTDDPLPEIPLGGGEGSGPTGDDAPSTDGESASTADDEPEPSVSLDGDVTNPADDETEPVEVLVQLARDGEIDPWDIDIVAVTDAFLAELETRDLRTSGRALFYASVLLRMKSDALLAPDEQHETAEPEPWETAFDEPEPVEADDGDPVDALEAEIDRRLERRSTRGSPETLDELVRELREAERDTWWKESREYDTSGSPEPTGSQTLQYRGGEHPRGGHRDGDRAGPDGVGPPVRPGPPGGVVPRDSRDRRCAGPDVSRVVVSRTPRRGAAPSG
jgi:segregation and condensation protein A